jgi:hypothetical protein
MFNIMALINVADKNFIYIHIYKCGGMSLRTLINQNMLTTEIGSSHSTANQIKYLCLEQNRMTFWETSFKFSFVRNPYDWAVSLYEFIRKLKSHENYNEVKDMSFQTFCAWYCDNVKNKKRNINGMFNTLTEFLCDDHGKLLVDYVGKVENYHADMVEVANRLKISIGNNDKSLLPHINISQREKDYRAYYDSTSRKIITDIFQADLNLFKYQY